MPNTYSYRNVNKIIFTDDDIIEAIASLPDNETLKTLATLTADVLNGKALKAFGDLADAMNAKVYKTYGTFEIQVPKSESEIREAALYKLRHHSEFNDLRDARGDAQGIETD